MAGRNLLAGRNAGRNLLAERRAQREAEQRAKRELEEARGAREERRNAPPPDITQPLGGSRPTIGNEGPSRYFESDPATRTSAAERAEYLEANKDQRGVGAPIRAEGYLGRQAAEMGKLGLSLGGGLARAVTGVVGEGSGSSFDLYMRDKLTDFARTSENIQSRPIVGSTEWEDVKENPLNVGSFIAE